MKCRDVMSSDIVGCFANEPVYKAAEQMKDKDIGFIPVKDGSKKLVGVITDRDLACRILADRKDYETPLEQVMTRDIVTVKADDDLEEAQRKMADRQIQRICVVNDNFECIGVISLQDVTLRGSEEESGELLREVKEGELGPAVH
ncbi:MAG: CBS domain-containing protein [Myxococcales bacterium]